MAVRYEFFIGPQSAHFLARYTQSLLTSLTHSSPTHLLIPFSLHQTCKLHVLSHPLHLCPLLPSPFALISTLHPYLISISLPTTPILLNYFPNLKKYIKIQHECTILTSANMGFSSTKTPMFFTSINFCGIKCKKETGYG